MISRPFTEGAGVSVPSRNSIIEAAKCAKMRGNQKLFNHLKGLWPEILQKVTMCDVYPEIVQRQTLRDIAASVPKYKRMGNDDRNI